MLRSKGLHYERLAEEYLVRHALRLLHRNYNCRVGEIDLIMEDGATLVFVEVRFRESARFGGALESITPKKQARVMRAAANFLQHTPRTAERPCRFDAVGITGSHAPLNICWIKGAFSA